MHEVGVVVVVMEEVDIEVDMGLLHTSSATTT
jgi:hypothetical protein